MKRMKPGHFPYLFLLCVAGVLGCKRHETDQVVEHSPQFYKVPEAPVHADSAMVVTAHPAASGIGMQVLQNGGNAVDAMVAVHFALAVCYPSAGTLAVEGL